MFWKAGDCILQNRSKIVKGENSDKWKFIFNLTLLNRILILSKDNKKIKDQVMKTKKDIVDNWLPRYTGRELKDFSKYILLTNFEYYLELFSELYQVPIVGADKTMPNVYRVVIIFFPSLR